MVHSCVTLNPDSCTLKTLNLAQVCDTTAELGMDLVPGNAWPELLPFLFQCTQRTEPRMVEAGLLIFAQLSGWAPRALPPDKHDSAGAGAGPAGSGTRAPHRGWHSGRASSSRGRREQVDGSSCQLAGEGQACRRHLPETWPGAEEPRHTKALSLEGDGGHSRRWGFHDLACAGHW